MISVKSAVEHVFVTGCSRPPLPSNVASCKAITPSSASPNRSWPGGGACSSPDQPPGRPALRARRAIGQPRQRVAAPCAGAALRRSPATQRPPRRRGDQDPGNWQRPQRQRERHKPLTGRERHDLKPRPRGPPVQVPHPRSGRQHAEPRTEKGRLVGRQQLAAVENDGPGKPGRTRREPVRNHPEAGGPGGSTRDCSRSASPQRRTRQGERSRAGATG